MGKNNSKHDSHKVVKDNTATVGEVNKSSGFHIFELHAPSMGMGFIALIFILFAIVALYMLYRKFNRNHHQQIYRMGGRHRSRSPLRDQSPSRYRSAPPPPPFYNPSYATYSAPNQFGQTAFPFPPNFPPTSSPFHYGPPQQFFGTQPRHLECRDITNEPTTPVYPLALATVAPLPSAPPPPPPPPPPALTAATRDGSQQTHFL